MGTSPIRKGAAWLDATYPGWEKAIDLSTLDLLDTYACVLGQVGIKLEGLGRGHEPPYSEMLGKIPLTSMEMGFALSVLDTWAALTRRWKRAVRYRLNKQP